MFEERAGDGEIVQQGSAAERLAIERDGAGSCFTPDHRDAALPGEFAQAVENPGTHAFDDWLLLGNDARVDGEKVEEDMSTPGPPTMGESQNG